MGRHQAGLKDDAYATVLLRTEELERKMIPLKEKLTPLEEAWLKAIKGINLRDLRTQYGLSQERCARICDVALRTWCRWEAGERTPTSFVSLARLFKYLREENESTRTGRSVA